MPKQITTTVYAFDELNDKAKEKAREWMREIEASDMDLDFVLEDAATTAGLIGIELKQVESGRRRDGRIIYRPAINYSGFGNQGDGASFLGRYSSAPAAAVREHAPGDKELHRIADELEAIQAKHDSNLIAHVADGRGRYSHEHSVDIAVSYMEGEHEEELTVLDGTAEESIKKLLRDFMRWIYQQLQAEWEYRLSDEAIDESILANEYTFTETGKRFG